MIGNAFATPLEYGRLIGSLPYQYRHWVTLTFKNPVSEIKARYYFERWIKWLDSVAQQRVYLVWALERGVNQRLHYHVLLARTEMLSGHQIKRGWKNERLNTLGISKAQKYIPSDYAAYYIAKEFAKNLIDWDIRDPGCTRSGKPKGMKRVKIKEVLTEFRSKSVIVRARKRHED